MKLRNKKTGGIWDIPKRRHPTCQEDDISFFAYGRDEGHLFSYKSLADLNKEWEDYEPEEPKIKDKATRKAVRAWAEVNLIEKALYAERPDRSLCNLTDMGADDFCIEFVGWIPTLKDGEEYTIDELCGEEE